MAVIKPLPLTVITGTAVELPNEPVLELTVASVALVIAVPVLPDRVKSPPVTDIEPDTAAVDTAVIKPLPLTVITGTAVDEPKEPVLLLTVAKVNALVPAVLVASPENAGSLAAPSVPLEILEALVVSVVAEATKPKLVLAVDTEGRSERLFVLAKKDEPAA